MKWVNLHVHSQYSVLGSTASVKELAAAGKKSGMEALALTDDGNLYGAVEFTKECQEAGVRPIIGCELTVAPESRKEKKKIGGIHGSPIILLAKNRIGYRNLCKLSSSAFIDGFYYTPRIDKELLSAHFEGLICLSGGLKGPIARHVLTGDEKALHEEVLWYQNLFKEDFYFELQNHEMSDEDLKLEGITKESWLNQSYIEYVSGQKKVIDHLTAMGRKLSIPCVATNDTHYIAREDWRAHEIMMNIQSGEPCEIWELDSHGKPKNKIVNPKRKTMPVHELNFKTEEEMALRFQSYPETLETSLTIAKKCDLLIDFKTKFYPVFVPPALEETSYTEKEREDATHTFMQQLCKEGIEKRYDKIALNEVAKHYPGKDPLEVVHQRVKYELDLIISKGMCDYLLIVYDFIAWAKRRGIPMGPGRGSGAGSIVLYLIGITDIEPLRFNLFFERFINPERLSYPDIDVDICMDRRSEVIDYTVQKYGHSKVAQIITFGTMKAKMAIKDVGRTLSIPLPKVNQIAKLIPDDLNMTLRRALEIDPDLAKLYKEDEEVHHLLNLALRLEGSVRNTGIHAAGIIICADPLTDHIPICNPKDSPIMVTQYSMKPVEAVGMLKIDFLGLKTLTSIQKAVEAIEESRGVRLPWINLPLDDKPTFDLLNQGKTLGIFQLESGGMQELAKQLHIDKFEEIIAVGALYRPGPMEMIPSFINRKHGREEIDIDHPDMREILSETYGIMVYQEQVMQIASKLAGYSLGEGDVLRRAMGKKDLQEMMRQREKFREGAKARGISEELSMRIFDKVEKFASYGFNKSHAAAYGYLTYVTAYLKANYPYEWMAALMTCDRDDLTKVSKVIRECQAMNIPILPPDINESTAEFAATSKGVRFALSAIKGVGIGIVDAIRQERKKSGPFTDLFDFFKRIDTKKVGKKVVEYLIEAGAFDFTGWSRGEMVCSVDPMHAAASESQKESAQGIMTLFSLIEEDEKPFSKPPKLTVQPLKAQLLRREKELLGFFLTGHPMDEYKHLLKKLSCTPFHHVATLSDGVIFRCAFIIESVQIKLASRSQKKFAILNVSDGIESIELPIWPELYEEKSGTLLENQLIYAILQKESGEGSARYQCKWLIDLTEVNDAAINACDTAFDKAKVLSKTHQLRKKMETKGGAEMKKERKKEVHEEKIPRLLKIKIDAAKIHFSHILEMKKMIQENSGKSALKLEFYADGRDLGSVEIDASWGITCSRDVENALREKSFVKEIEIVH